MIPLLRGPARPGCRFARQAAEHPHIAHVCTRADGRPVRIGSDCFAEARAQLLEARTATARSPRRASPM